MSVEIAMSHNHYHRSNHHPVGSDGNELSLILLSFFISFTFSFGEQRGSGNQEQGEENITNKKEGPNYEMSGKLTEYTNTYKVCGSGTLEIVYDCGVCVCVCVCFYLNK